MFNRIMTGAIVGWTVFMGLGITLAAMGIGQDSGAIARGAIGLALLVILWAVGLAPLALAWLASRPKGNTVTPPHA